MQGRLLADDDLPDALALAQATLRAGTPGHWDEWRGGVNGAGAPSARWQAFMRHLGNAGWSDLAARARHVQHRVREDGATYNVYDESGDASRPWPLELLPVILEADEWAVIEHGVQQRAQMLEATLKDLYGERRLLRDALLPASLVFAHPHYLRPVHGLKPAGGNYLHIVAFDLARAPEGGFCVLAQRLQAPSGLGYLLENRLIVGQQFSEPFAAMRVQRLASNFRHLLDGLVRASPAGERSHIALLTPGPMNETYFEHVFLARYLGITLVEGHDLTVRGQRLYLQTLHGLERVHVLLRRLDDVWLDPLELRPDSLLGVPGLMQAVRAGEVVVANAPGAGVLESPGLDAFWPAVARRLLAQELLLPAAASWWCGEAAVWAAQRHHLSSWVVAPTFPDSNYGPVVAGLMGAMDREAMMARIDANPAAFTLQARVHPSETPVWIAGRLEPRAAVMRVFALADGLGGWRVLPGAMTRVAGPADGGRDPWLSMQHGSASADTWVITRGEVDSASLLPQPLTAQDLQGWGRGVTSRAAENLFWLGRYTERAENTARLARMTLESLTDSSPAVLTWLDALARRHGVIGAGVPAPWQSSRLFERALVGALGDAASSRSVAFNLLSLRDCAVALRERLSPEHWKLIHEVGDHFQQHWAHALAAGDGHAAVPDVLGIIGRAATHLAAITGAQTDRMTRDDGWRLLSVGRQIERLEMLSDALESAINLRVHEADDGFSLVLGLFDSLITYRAQFQARRELMPLLHLVVMDTDNPRSLAWVARTMRDRLRKLARHDSDWVSQVSAGLPVPEAWSLAELGNAAADGGHEALLRSLRHCGHAARNLSDEIGRHLLLHVSTPERSVWQ